MPAYFEDILEALGVAGKLPREALPSVERLGQEAVGPGARLLRPTQAPGAPSLRIPITLASPTTGGRYAETRFPQGIRAGAEVSLPRHADTPTSAVHETFHIAGTERVPGLARAYEQATGRAGLGHISPDYPAWIMANELQASAGAVTVGAPAEHLYRNTLGYFEQHPTHFAKLAQDLEPALPKAYRNRPYGQGFAALAQDNPTDAMRLLTQQMPTAPRVEREALLALPWLKTPKTRLEEMATATAREAESLVAGRVGMGLGIPKTGLTTYGDIASDVLRLHHKAGGATYNLAEGDMTGQPFYSVGMYPERTQTIEGQLTRNHIMQFMNANMDLLHQPRHAIGTWLNEADGKTYLDVVGLLEGKDRALREGAKYGQQAIYDLAKRNTLDVPSLRGVQLKNVQEELEERGRVILGRMPTTERLLQMYHQGLGGINFYEGVDKEFEAAFGQDARLALDFLAATSQRSRAFGSAQRVISNNLSLMTKAYEQYKLGKNFEGFAPAVRMNLEAAVRGDPLHGLKIGEMAKALKGDPNAVVLDAWMARLLNQPQDSFSDPAKYNFLAERIRQQAAKAGVTPRQYQAGLWKAYREKFGQKTGKGYIEQVKEFTRPTQPRQQPLNLTQGNLTGWPK